MHIILALVEPSLSMTCLKFVIQIAPRFIWSLRCGKEEDICLKFVIQIQYKKWRHVYRKEEEEKNYTSTFYEVYNVLKARWTKSCTPFNCMAHSLNPRQIYPINTHLFNNSYVNNWKVTNFYNINFFLNLYLLVLQNNGIERLQIGSPTWGGREF